MNLGYRWRYFIVTVVLVAAVDLAAGVYLAKQLRDTTVQRIEAELARDVRTVGEVVEFVDDSQTWSVDVLDPVADRLGGTTETRVTLIAPDGTVVGDSWLTPSEIAEVENHRGRPEVAAAHERGRGHVRRFSSTVQADMLYLAEPIRGGTVRVAKPLREVDHAIRQLRLALVFAGLIALALAMFAGVVASDALSRRLRNLMEATRAMAEGDAEQRLPVSSRDEIGGIAGSFNRVAAELERTVKALAAERDRFEAVLQNMHEAVLAIDADSKVIAVNRAATDLLQLERSAEGLSLLEVIRLPQLAELARGALAGEALSQEFELETVAAVRRVLVRATPQGKGGGAVLVLHDVTEVRRLETVRRDFVANVSHELRTPVSIIQANTETLLAGAIDEPVQARRFLEAVRRNAERLGQLISDLLDISRIEAGKYRIEPRPLRCQSVTRSVAKGTSESCRRRDVQLAVDCPDDLWVRADAGALEQILVNLVENAVKYGPEGGRVELRVLSAGAAVRFEVADDGPGIDPAHRRRVFERFYRVDPGRSRNMGGTGLGLAIVKNLAEVMGGDVGVEPREPHGSVFWVRLGAASARDDDPDETEIVPGAEVGSG